MKLAIPSLRQSAAWVTDLTRRYRFDPQVRTTIQIIVLEVGLTLLSILIFGWALKQAEQGTFGPLSHTYSAVFAGMIFLNSLFGYLIAHFALRPTREALSFQKRFIADVAHEIRTPLAIIKTSTEVSLMDPHLPPAVRETFEETNNELNRISETINNLLSLEALMAPRGMRFEQVDVSALARTVVARHRELADSRGIALSAEIADDIRVNGKESALEQALTQLVKNALNFTPAHRDGTVGVEVTKAASGGATISVMDTGIGIAEKDLYHIFEPFYRADTSRARGIGTGTSGLGLAIVHEIVRIHKGTITLRSAPKHGTTIRLSFPPVKEQKDQTVLAPSGSPHEATLDFS